MVRTRLASTGYVEPRFFWIALSQVHPTQTNAAFGVNLGGIWREPDRACSSSAKTGRSGMPPWPNGAGDRPDTMNKACRSGADHLGSLSLSCCRQHRRGRMRRDPISEEEILAEYCVEFSESALVSAPFPRWARRSQPGRCARTGATAGRC